MKYLKTNSHEKRRGNMAFENNIESQLSVIHPHIETQIERLLKKFNINKYDYKITHFVIDIIQKETLKILRNAKNIKKEINQKLKETNFLQKNEELNELLKSEWNEYKNDNENMLQTNMREAPSYDQTNQMNATYRNEIYDKMGINELAEVGGINGGGVYNFGMCDENGRVLQFIENSISKQHEGGYGTGINKYMCDGERNQTYSNMGNDARNNAENDMRNYMKNDISIGMRMDVANNMGNHVGDNMGNDVRNNVGDNIGNNVENNIANNMENNVANNMENNVANNMENNVGNNIANNMGNNVANNMENNVGNNIGNNMGDNNGNSMRDNIGNNIGDNAGNNIGDNTGNNIGDNTGNNIGDNMEDVNNNSPFDEKKENTLYKNDKTGSVFNQLACDENNMNYIQEKKTEEPHFTDLTKEDKKTINDGTAEKTNFIEEENEKVKNTGPEEILIIDEESVNLAIKEYIIQNVYRKRAADFLYEQSDYDENKKKKNYFVERDIKYPTTLPPYLPDDCSVNTILPPWDLCYIGKTSEGAKHNERKGGGNAGARTGITSGKIGGGQAFPKWNR